MPFEIGRFAFELAAHKVASEEQFFNPGWFSPLSETFYTLHPSEESSFDFQKAQLRVDIFAARKNQSYSRTIYNGLDLLGDVGGLMDAFKLIAGTLVGLITNGGLVRNLIVKFFFFSSSSQSDFDDLQGPVASEQQSMQDKVQTALKMERATFPFNCDILTKWCSLRAARRRQRFSTGSDRISEQLDIAKFLERQFMLDTLLKVSLNPLERFLMRYQSKPYVIDSDDDPTSKDPVPQDSIEAFEAHLSGRFVKELAAGVGLHSKPRRHLLRSRQPSDMEMIKMKKWPESSTPDPIESRSENDASVIQNFHPQGVEMTQTSHYKNQFSTSTVQNNNSIITPTENLLQLNNSDLDI